MTSLAVIAVPGALLLAAVFGPLVSLSALTLVIIWVLSLRGGYVSAVPLAFSLHWLQLFSGVMYEALTGRRVEGGFDVERMGYVGICYLLVMFAGFWLASSRLRLSGVRAPSRGLTVLAATRLYLLWLPVSLVLVAVAWQIPGVTQQVLALGTFRFVFLTLLLQQLANARRWRALAGVLIFELLLGFSSLFAEFKLPLLLALAVLLDAARLRLRGARVAAAVTFGSLALAAVVWTGIKTEVRAELGDSSRTERLARAVEHTSAWAASQSISSTLDRLVGRIWELEYPARVLDRVPRAVPHEDGALLLRAVRHVLIPRLLDPSKPRLMNDSELVRRYAGVRVAGEESGTSIGLSFVAESYIDFGIPGMFAPLFGFGLLAGLLFSLLERQLSASPWVGAMTTCLVLMSLQRFEVPWTKVLGSTITTVVVVGVGAAAWGRLRRDRASTGPSRRRPRRPARMETRLT